MDYKKDTRDELFFSSILTKKQMERVKIEEAEIISDYIKDYDDLEEAIKDVTFINTIEDAKQNESKAKSTKKGVEITSVHKGHRNRVREKFLKYGLDCFSEFEVLEFLLFYAIPYKDTNEIAHALIDKFGSVKAVLEAEYYDIAEVTGMGEYSASLIVLFRELQKYINTHNRSKFIIDTSYKAGEFCIDYFKNHVEESFILLSLDEDLAIKCIDVISSGTETQTAFYPRRVLKAAMKNRTGVVILAHNHPSGPPEPSTNDLHITAIIEKIMHNIGIVVMDHIICGPHRYVSMSDKGLLTK